MKTLQDLKDIKAAKHGQIDIRFNPDTAEEAVRTYVLVCGGTGCQSNHSVEVMDELRKHIDASGKKDDIQIIQTGCPRALQRDRNKRSHQQEDQCQKNTDHSFSSLHSVITDTPPVILPKMFSTSAVSCSLKITTSAISPGPRFCSMVGTMES